MINKFKLKIFVNLDLRHVVLNVFYYIVYRCCYLTGDFKIVIYVTLDSSSPFSLVNTSKREQTLQNTCATDTFPLITLYHSYVEKDNFQCKIMIISSIGSQYIC